MNELVMASPLKAKIRQLEAEMKVLPQLDIPIDHFFCEGVYARKMTMPKDSAVVGKIHTHGQINILSKGDVSVTTEKGVERLKAGAHLVYAKGAQRAFYAHEESCWTVILATDETDVEKIEHEFVVETEQQYLEFQKRIAA